MSVKPISLLLMWTLSSLFQDVTSFCNVTCTTDYVSSLNCSCLNTVPTYPMQLKANCSDHEEYVNGSCEIKPPLSWCLVKPKGFTLITSIGTTCIVTANYFDSQIETNVNETRSWDLSDIVKPPMPFNVQVTESAKEFNVTWDVDTYLKECLTYRVRLRWEKDPGDCQSLEQTYLVLPRDKLQPDSNYKVEVQAWFCRETFGLMGPGSEWSVSAEFNTVDKGWKFSTTLLIFIAIFIIILFCSFALLARQNPFWMKRFQLITYVPRPDVFFKPLYHTYEGNFKDWVRPAYSECDLLFNTPGLLLKEKQQEVLPIWNTVSEQSERKPGGCFLDNLYPYPSPISIHTVTLSGEEEPTEAFVSSLNTLGSYQDAQSFTSAVDGGFGGAQQSGVLRDVGFTSTSLSGRVFPLDVRVGEAERVSLDSFTCSEQSEDGYPRVGLETIDSGFGESDRSSPVNSESNPAQMMVSRFFKVGGSSSKGCPLDVHVHEAERVSLDSFASNEQSEDGYPRVDLDTIDSGFGESECSSPVNSESNPTDHVHSAFFSTAGSSNYVKQWVISKTLQGDPSPHVPE